MRHLYTAVLVWMTQRLAITAAMSQPRKLTAIHDISGPWNGIGAGINALWQQTKVMSAPSTIFFTLAYLGAISGLHIVSSSVIQFEAFNNTVAVVVPSTMAWPSPSVNLSDLTWGTIVPLVTLWPLLPTAKGLSGSTLYDVPSSDFIYTGAFVNATNITAECGLLPNVPGGTWNSSEDTYHVDISGLGKLDLGALELTNFVSFFTLGTFLNHTSPNYIGYRVATGIELGNLTDEVIHVTTTSKTEADILGNLSITTYFVACTLNATSTILYLPMQNGRTTQNASFLSDSQPASWTVWSPSPATELTQIFNIAQNGYGSQTVFSTGPLFCEGVEAIGGAPECDFTTVAEEYINNLLGIPWTYGAVPAVETPSPSITLGQREMENAVAELGATFMWLAGAAGTESGGFQQTQGESMVTNTTLMLRLNVNFVPVVIGLAASLILLAIVVWMGHDFPTTSKASFISSGVLELVWISTHSNILQDLMKAAGSSSSDQLRLRGMKIKICLADVTSTVYHQGNDTNKSIQPALKAYAPDWQEYTKGKLFFHYICYAFHAILLALHVVLILLLMHYPEHHVTMASDNPWVTTALSVSLQAFYTLYTAGLVFVTQQLAVSTLISQWHYLTAIHDISQAWSGIGAAVSTLWQQTKTSSSIWTLMGVTIYLACVSVLHITSTAIMEFTPFNSTSTISIQSSVTWPNSTVLTNGSWAGPSEIVPPNTLLANMETVGLLNNTVYDIVNTTNPAFTTAVVNATSLTSGCGLVPNITYFSTNISTTLNFSVDGLGFWSFLFNVQSFKKAKNQVVFFSLEPSLLPLSTCPSCDQYLFFLITTNVELDQSIDNKPLGLSVNIANAGGPPIMAYLAACTLVPDAGFATLDLQTNALHPNPIQSISYSWKLWTPGTGGSSNLINGVS
ncbi:hypothetical protein L210DRAFT_3760707 [Boletus edulis BED1]|uniref:ML-like domain-containing protein n=1 Tax=Boletus edulis BED1 TaxID=1328754 RepID=A0AAD4GDZ6_BOLED|nr:hypothetical protein L210DRAFT_3760707 [Boletus edulis BED1]